MSLHVQSFGAGPDIVLLHGWGLHAGVWIEVAQQLATRFRITLIDLPGHGRSVPMHVNMDDDYSLQSVAARVVEAAPPHAVWLGWSLGGMVAMHTAISSSILSERLAAPPRVKALILVASTPQFVRDADWPYAMELPVLESFAQALQENHTQTLQRFLALVASGIPPLATLVEPFAYALPCTSQTRGAAQGQDTLRRLRSAVMQYPPQPEALQGGLAILRDTRLRPCLHQITCPVQIVLGEGDTLVPCEVGPILQSQMNDARLQVIAGAGHAPFLSHPMQFIRCISEFLDELR